MTSGWRGIAIALGGAVASVIGGVATNRVEGPQAAQIAWFAMAVVALSVAGVLMRRTDRSAPSATNAAQEAAPAPESRTEQAAAPMISQTGSNKDSSGGVFVQVSGGFKGFINTRGPRSGYGPGYQVFVVALLLLVLLVAVILIAPPTWWSDLRASDSPAPIPPTSTPPVIDTDDTEPPPADPSPAYGSALKFKIQYVGAMGGPKDVAFPASAKGQIERFNALLGLSGTSVPEDAFPAGMMTEMRYGGYALAGMAITVQVENTSSRPLSISAIRVTELRKSPIATGAVFYLPSGAGDGYHMFFDLDWPDPIPRVFTSATDLGDESPPTEMPFLRAHGVPIAANGRSTPLDIVFDADNAAYDFAVAFDYTFQNDDRKYTQTLLNGNQLWRVTGSACRTDQKSGNTTYKPDLRYEFVRDMAYLRDEYVTVLSTPARGCTRLQP